MENRKYNANCSLFLVFVPGIVCLISEHMISIDLFLNR